VLVGEPMVDWFWVRSWAKGENVPSYRLGVGCGVMSSHHKNSIVLNPMMRPRC